MTKLVNTVVNRWVLASACAAVALAVPQIARAQDAQDQGAANQGAANQGPANPGGGTEKTEQKGGDASASASLGLGGATTEARAGEDKPAEGVEHEEKETKLQLGVDFVIGFGKTPVVTSILPGTLATVPENVVDASKIQTESFVIGGSYEIFKNFGVGLRLPFALGTFTPPGRQTRSTTALGSLELEGEYEMHLNEHMKLIYALGVALPTAQGDEVPKQEELDRQTGAIDQNNYDRFALNRAVASSRGFEENALFEPKRLGFIPKVGLDYEVSKVMIQPYVKLENLISTVSGAQESYLGELVLGTFLGYRVVDYLDAGVRVWGNVPIAGGGSAVGVLEPQVRGHIGNVMPVLGAIIPFAGPLTDPQFAGVRLALASRF